MSDWICGTCFKPEPECACSPGTPDRLTTTAAATALGVSARRVRALVAAGRLAAVREETPRGPVIWVDAASLASFVRQPQGWQKGRPRKVA